MTTKITAVQCRWLRSALNSRGRAALGTFLWLAGDSADWPVTATAATEVHLEAEAWALSHFLCRFWSKSPGQPTSLYSSVNAGKKALISFLPTSRRPCGGIAKSHPRGQHCDALPPHPAVSTTPLNQAELLALPPPQPLFVSPRPSKETHKPLCCFLQLFKWNKYCLISLVLFV